MPPNGGRALCTATASAAALLFLPAARALCAAAGACALYAEVAGDPSRPWKWNLSPLCNNGKGYAFNNGSSQYRFEICGSIDPGRARAAGVHGRRHHAVPGSGQRADEHVLQPGVQRVPEHGQLPAVLRPESRADMLLWSHVRHASARRPWQHSLRRLPFHGHGWQVRCASCRACTALYS